MRQIYIILAAAALAGAVSCSKVEADPSTSPDVKIGYLVASYATQTKADDGGFLKEMEAFGITSSDALFKSVAFINADDGNGSQAEPARFYAAATDEVETIKYNSTGKFWAPAGADYYWPKSPNSDLDFFSWFDLTENASTHVANATYASSTYTLAWTDDRIISLKDNVMYADPVWKQKQNTNGTYKKDGVTEGVPTLFHHALAQVRFQFKQATMSRVDSKDDTKSTFWVVKVKNLTIPANALRKNGTLSLTAAKSASWTTPANLIWGAAATPAFWTTSDIFLANAVNATGIELTDTADTFSKDDQMTDEYITVLPQQIGDGFLLNFDIEIETKFGTTSGGASSAAHVSTETIHVKDFASGGALVKDSGIKLNLLTAIGSYWQMNKKYTYLFVIDPETTKILYDPAVEAWADDTSATQNIPNA